jgi:2-polyprenyl-3-methyl-5-hydroxy-6-metoxy-1,4-benzoquinol methylase
MTVPYEYVGSELDLFAQAKNWKRYFARHFHPFVGGDVLEVGAGVGGTFPFLRTGRETSWSCLEPDAELLERLKVALYYRGVSDGGPPVRLIHGTTKSIPAQAEFDCIVYIDVLEHIEDDAQELARAVSLLRPNGHLCVLSPAHQWLFTPFDTAVGHFRRYTLASLQRLTPRNAAVVRLRYLDSVGVLASVANRVLLRSAIPSRRQVLTWDRCMVPTSRVLDKMLGYRVGKSVIGVWKRLQ